MAAEKALYKGHAVAAVAAINNEIAEQAAALIDVDYEVLPAVTDVLGNYERRRPCSARKTCQLHQRRYTSRWP
ncbi:MAG: hypothetical protein CM1200mP22_03980 [Dehalococcoidia bacterium]|nr:MAG: hypothetical protein CM1200mP22_03980 [Dehalococcoidia bacterium]